LKLVKQGVRGVAIEVANLAYADLCDFAETRGETFRHSKMSLNIDNQSLYGLFSNFQFRFEFQNH
jgi:hypothetical protein